MIKTFKKLFFISENNLYNLKFTFNFITPKTFYIPLGWFFILITLILSLLFFSIYNGSIQIQLEKQRWNEAKRAEENKISGFNKWLSRKIEFLDNYYMISGLEGEKTISDEESDIYENTKSKFSILERMMHTLSDFTIEREDYFWHVPTICPVKLSDFYSISAEPHPLAEEELAGLSSLYGSRKQPVSGKRKVHYGIDIFCKENTSVIAPSNGTVTFSGKVNINVDHARGLLGNYIEIQHGDTGIVTRYAHLSKILVKKGEVVKCYQKIGEVGTTGLSTGPHLHYEVIKNGVRVNPLNYILDVRLIDNGKKVFFRQKSGG